MYPAFDETPEFFRVREVVQATHPDVLHDMVTALRTLGEEVRGGYVPWDRGGVCRECSARCPEWDMPSSMTEFHTVVDVLMYVAWHWPHATVKPVFGVPTEYFCDAVPGTHRWAGENLSKRLEFIEFAINFLEGYAK